MKTVTMLDHVKLCYNESRYLESLDSYIKAECDDDLKHITIGTLVDTAAELFPNKIALSQYEGEKITYHQLREKVDQLIIGLLSFDLQKGDHIGIWGSNSIEWCISFLAITKAGFVAVTLNPLFEAPEAHRSLLNMDVKLLISDEYLGTRRYYDLLSEFIPEIKSYECCCRIECETLPLLKSVVIMSKKFYRGTYSWYNLLIPPSVVQLENIQNLARQVKEHDVCNIIFTSGTTSDPKGAQLTHHNLVNNSYFSGKRLKYSEKDHVACTMVPFFHSFGVTLGMLSVFHFGNTVVIPFQKYSPSNAVKAIYANRCTISLGTSTMNTDMLNAFNQMKDNGTEPSFPLQIMVSGGSLCLPETFVKLKDGFRLKQIYSGYGMTESSPATFLSVKGEPLDITTTSVGFVMPHIEVKVINEKNEILPMGTPGELCVRGYTVMKGYYKNDEKTKLTISEDGWLFTGDRFVLSKNGYGKIVGRIKDTIIRGGENIEPLEIEEVIILHPDVEDVHVYGVCDERLGENVAASIKLKPGSIITENDIKQFCFKKISTFKIPQHIQFINSFPKTASGKVQKNKLREMLEQELALK